MTRLGLVTIGQSPREDVIYSMFADTEPEACDQAGALDDLSDERIEELAPRQDEHPLVSRLRSGAEVVVAKERLMPHVQQSIDLLVSRGAAVITVLCTGEFPVLRACIPIIYPDRILAGTVNGVLPAGTLGVLMPHDGQYESMRAKWHMSGRAFTGATISPYSSADDIESQAARLRDDGADLIVMDCMGYTEAMREQVRETTGLPTVLANRLVGRVLQELLSI